MTDPRAASLWGDVCRQLQEVLHPDVYARWIAVIEPLRLDDSTLTLAVDNDFYQSWLEENYLPLIGKALDAASAEPLKIAFHVKAKSAEPEPAEPAPRRRTIRERLAPRARGAAAV